MNQLRGYYFKNNLIERTNQIKAAIKQKIKGAFIRDKKAKKGKPSHVVNQPNALGRKRHPKEASYTKASNYGKILFEFTNDDAIGFIDEKGGNMTLVDLFEHVIVFGGSGTGKTYSILQPLWEEWFRTTHIEDNVVHSVVMEPGKAPIKARREDVRFGGLVVEAKGDFRDKTWYLAQKYGRMDDCVYFGPTHQDVVYNMFGDPSESALQKANKILEILKSFSGGKASSDPFWDNASRKLFLNIFILHDYIEKAFEEAKTPEEKEKFKIPKMSFQLLNLLLMDRGHPQNAGEIQNAQGARDLIWDQYETALRGIDSTCIQMDRVLREVFTQSHALIDEVNRLTEIYKKLSEEYQKDFPDTAVPIGADEEAKKVRLEAVQIAGATLALPKEIYYALDGLAQSILSTGAGKNETFLTDLATIREGIANVLYSESDAARGKASTETRDLATTLKAGIEQKRMVLQKLPNAQDLGWKEMKANTDMCLVQLLEHITVMLKTLEKLVNFKMPEPKIGALQSMIAQHELILKAQKKEPQLDSVWAFFREEYLNPANDKTSGSVAMVASNLVALFVHPPFSLIFSPEGTFSFNRVIDEGKIVYLDMPTAYYGASATVAMLVMKIDFFRCMLSRPRLHKRGANGEMLEELVNQIRPIVYFCDEFASIVTTGAETGEASFLDKVREFKGSCILGTQSIPMLLKTIQDNEVDAILTNTAIKIFLRNTDIKTNEFASKLLGQRVRVNANLNQGAMESMFADNSRPVGQRTHSTSYAKEARFELGDFSRLVKGQAIVCINPRFGRHQIQKLCFKGRPCPPPDNSPGFGVPVTHLG